MIATAFDKGSGMFDNETHVFHAIYQTDQKPFIIDVTDFDDDGNLDIIVNTGIAYNDCGAIMEMKHT